MYDAGKASASEAPSPTSGAFGASQKVLAARAAGNRIAWPPSRETGRDCQVQRRRNSYRRCCSIRKILSPKTNMDTQNAGVEKVTLFQKMSYLHMFGIYVKCVGISGSFKG